ncbi:glycosyltransferase [Akkermansiaceae bacterium]|nr:glycosyltransferase [Akkermansiaceae bacterium]
MSGNLKILQIIDSLNVGGSERMSINIYNTLTDHNINNKLIVTRKEGPLYKFIKDPRNVYFLNKKNSCDFFAFLRLLKIIVEYKPSIVHVHQTSIYWMFLVKVFLPQTKVIWHDHWGFSDLLNDSDRKLIRRFSFLLDGVVCVNEKIREWNIRNLKVREELVVFIRNYPLLKQLERDDKPSSLIVCVANIRDQKDHPNLLEACAILKKEKIDFKLLLVGSHEDISWVDKVKRMIKDLKLDNEVKLLGAVSEISEILTEADLGVLSSVSEGLPVSLLEYGLMSLPVVCTDVGQCSEVLGNGEYGWLVPPKSPKRLALAMKEALLNKDKAKERSLKLKNNIEENYGANNFINSYLKFLEILN